MLYANTIKTFIVMINGMKLLIQPLGLADKIGSLTAGKQADFVVLDRDYMAVPEEEIEDLYSVMTVVEGKVVYTAP